MAKGNNRAAKQARAHFRQAGGSLITFRHPYLAGQIDTASAKVDEIDISAACKLDGRFFEASQNQDSARQVVLVDGSVVTITNSLLNGTINIPAIPTTGEVATGDFIAACQLIRSTGDSVGGLVYKTDFINGKAKTRLYYGVTVQSCPDDISEGNDVPVYNVRLLYAGWIEANSSSLAENKKRIWAVGTQQGLEAYFSPYPIQNASGETGTNKAPMDADAIGGVADDLSSAYNADCTDGTTEQTVFEGKWLGGKIIREPAKIGDAPTKTPEGGKDPDVTE